MKHLIVIILTVCCVGFAAVPALAAVSVSLSPKSASISTGSQLQFVAAVSGTTDSVVIWGVSGPGCSGVSCGTISSSGLYTAPATAPSPATVTVEVMSLADVTATAASTITIASPSSVSINVSPSQVVLATGGKQQFTALVTGISQTAVTWSISGIGCVNSTCGTISSSGLYTAPTTVPPSAAIAITATSVAQPAKSGTASLVVQSASAVSVAVQPKTAQVASGGQVLFTATVTGSTNTAVLWTVSGAGCSGVACGTITSGGIYTAPASLPHPASVTVKATAVSDPAASASAAVTLVAGSSVSVSPPSVQLKPGAQQQFTATVGGSSSSLVVWSISGSGCSGTACGSISSTGLYTAPANLPNPPIIAVTATSVSSPAESGSATVTVSSGSSVGVSIAPTSAQVGVGGHQQFTATLTGSSNTSVTWKITGTGCAGNTCGTISSSGLFTAPAVPPSPPFFSVTATSVADPSKSATASVTVVSVVTVIVSPGSVKLVPSGSQQFTAQVTGNSNTSVTWSISGSGCTGSGCGKITSGGLYTAPPVVPNPPLVTLTATSQGHHEVGVRAGDDRCSSSGSNFADQRAADCWGAAAIPGECYWKQQRENLVELKRRWLLWFSLRNDYVSRLVYRSISGAGSSHRESGRDLPG